MTGASQDPDPSPAPPAAAAATHGVSAHGPLSGAHDAFGFTAQGGAPTAAAGLRAGDVVGDVVITGPLAEGGMGSVYAGREQATGRAVAVKLIRDPGPGPAARERFLREARLLARLRHPAVAHLHAFGTHQTTHGPAPYLVLELVADARPLTQFADERQLTVRERVRLFRDACLGVAHAHEHGIVHRDIKPGNLLVDAAGTPRVIDFGVARTAAGAAPDGADTGSFATATGEIVGTLQYMSPEQIQGDGGAVDARSDVYALGLLLHELVAGVPPYDLRHASYLEAVRIVGGAAPSSAVIERSVQAECGRDDARSLAVVVATCLAREPADRYATAGALAADLGRWLDGHPLVARPPTAWESLRRLARRHRTATALAGGAAVLLLTALGGITWLSVREHGQRRAAEAARRDADAARDAAEREAAAARQRLYLSTVLLAAEARDRDNVAEATRLVAAARELAAPVAEQGEPIELACLAASLDESSAAIVRGPHGITAVAATADGRLVAAAGEDGRLRLRPHDAAAAGSRDMPTGHEGRVWRLAFSPDGRWLASAGADGRVVVRDVGDDAVVAELTPHGGPVYGVAFSPDGTRLASVGRDGHARLYDTSTWREESMLRAHVGSALAVAFAADGTVLATAGSDGTARIWSATDGGERLAVAVGDTRVFDVAFSAAGDVLATAAEDGDVRLWDVGTGEERRRLPHPVRVNAIAFVGLGPDVVTACGDGMLRVWDGDTGAMAHFRGHADAVWSVACIDQRQVVTGSDDGTVRSWAIDGGAAPVVAAGTRVLATAFAPDGRTVAAGLDDGAVALWDAISRGPVARLEGGSGRVSGVAFSADGAWLAGASDDGVVAIWSVADRRLERAFRLHRRRVYAVAFSADGQRLLTASEDGTARISDVATGAPTGARFRHGRRVFAAAFSPDESHVATASEDRSVRLWDAATGVERRCFTGHDGPVNSVTFAPDGQRLVSASSDATVRLWDVAEGTCVGVLTGPARQVWKATFSPDGARVAAVTAEATTWIWEAAGGELALTLRGDVDGDAAAGDTGMGVAAGWRRGHGDQVWGLAFAPDGRRFATGSWDGTVRIWGVAVAEAAALDRPGATEVPEEQSLQPAVAAPAPAAGSWNQFRGPAGTGHTAATLPLEWSETKHVRWKTPVPGKAWASPVEADGRIWLANATEDGRRLSAVCVDAATGRLLHDVTLFEPAEPMYCHPYNSHASPTPVVTGGRVFMHFGSAGTAAVDAATGAVLWKRDDLPCDHHRGPGSSPIPVDDRLVINFDGFDVQYVVALDQATGATIWKTDRTIDYGSDNGDLKKAYCTPTVIEHGGRRQLVSPAAVGTVAYDPATGRELWKVHHGGFNAAARPLFAGGVVVIAVEGGDRVVAVRPDGEGDVTRTHVAWKFGKSTPTRPSLCAHDDHLYMVSDRGIFTCVDLRTGESRWQERREGRHSAALVEAQGRLYACDEDGTTVVVAASPDGFRVLAENRLDDGCMASPCVVDDDLVLRTKTHLYRIGE